MKVVVLVPRRADGGRRDELWAFTKAWLERHHPDYEIFEGDNPLSEGLFNRSLAINRAAKAAGDWDVAIVHDGDNICEPEALEEAVAYAADHQVMTFAGDTYSYCSQANSDRMLRTGRLISRPQIYDVREQYKRYLIHKHISGIQAVPRSVWEKTGGFFENLNGWGSDDSIFAVLCNLFGGGVHWIPESTIIHFWHDHSKADTERSVVAANRVKLLTLKRFEHRKDRAGARAYMAELGHTVP